MKFKKPSFWDYKKPNIISYLLLPFSFIINFINFLNNKNKIKPQKIKTICVGNIYIGGTGKTPISIEINKFLKNLNYKTAYIKKNYYNQIDEQKLLSSSGQLYCEKNRIDAVKLAINQNVDVAIFDDGLQDKNLNYDITFVCFNIQSWIGNGFCLPSGPLRENLKSIKKYDAVFLNGNGENISIIQSIIKSINPEMEIFEAQYMIKNIEILQENKNYLAFSGIGNPNSFLETLKINKFKIIKTLDFPDHYNYSDKDILKIKETAKYLDAKIITTEKDYNRLNKLNTESIDFLKIELNIQNKEKFINFLKKKI